MKQDAKDLVIHAQRKLKEVALDFGGEFANAYRRQIDDLCQKISNSLKNNDEITLNCSQSHLQEVLYELNCEVRSRYDTEWNTNFH